VTAVAVVDGRIAGLEAEGLAAEFGTPLYVYDLDAIDGRVAALRAALPPTLELAFAAKANPALAVLAHMELLGLGLDGAAALAEILSCPPDVALLDTGMPEMDGLQVTRALRAAPATALLPIILVTARGRLDDKVAGLDAGASDFITKPFEPAELLARVRSNLRLSSALARLENTQDVLVALASAVDAKDPLTEHHCGRVADQALVLAHIAGLAPDEIEAVGYGAVLHDVGKIGIAEAILLKPGRLTDEERAEMQRHPIVGAEIFSPLRLGKIVGPIVRGHHERWDGAGYPDGLRGDAIPIGGKSAPYGVGS